MKNKLSIISFLIIYMMNICSFTVTAKEINDTISHKSVDVLFGLNFIEAEKNLRLDDLITRGEFVTIIAKLINADYAVSETTKQIFSDVTIEHKAFQSVYNIYQFGLISGNIDGTFRPDEPMKTVDAVKILLSLLGYDKYAEYNGGYPTGYMTIAAQNGLMKNIKQDENLSRLNAFQVVYNSFNVNVLRCYRVIGDKWEYKSIDHENLLYLYHKIRETKGMVVSNEYTSLDNLNGDTNVGKLQVKIDNIVFNVGKTNVADFLGFEVDFYYHEDDANEIIYAEKINKDDRLRIFSKDILSESNSRQILYHEDGNNKTRTANLDDTSKIIYNGKHIFYYGEKDFKPTNGYLELYDNNTDGIYDLVFIHSYDTLVVDNTYDGKIYFKYGSYDGISYLECENNSSTVKIILDNKEVSSKELYEWDIINIEKSKDGKHITVLSEFKRVSGVVDEINKEDGYISVDGTIYYIALAGYCNKEKIYLGETYDFYLNLEDEVFVDDKLNASIDMNYGYICTAKLSDDMEEKLALKIFSITGQMDIFEFKSKVKLYSQDYLQGKLLKPSEVSEQLKKYGDGGSYNQLIMFETNDEKTLKTIYIAVNAALFSSIDEYAFRFDTKRSSANGSTAAELYAYQYILDFRYNYKQTKFFSIPNDRTEEKKYKILAPGSLPGDKYTFGDVAFYNTDSNGKPSIGIVSELGSSGIYDENSKFGIVAGVSHCLSEDEPVTKLQVVGKTSESIVATANFESSFNGETNFYLNTKLSDIKIGDCVIYDTDSYGKINQLRILFKMDAKGSTRILPYAGDMAGVISYNPSISLHYAYGIVDSFDGGDVITLLINANKINYFLLNGYGTNSPATKDFYMCQKSGNQIKISKAEKSDIQEGDEVILHWTWPGTQMVYIIRD